MTGNLKNDSSILYWERDEAPDQDRRDKAEELLADIAKAGIVLKYIPKTLEERMTEFEYRKANILIASCDVLEGKEGSKEGWEARKKMRHNWTWYEKYSTEAVQNMIDKEFPGDQGSEEKAKYQERLDLCKKMTDNEALLRLEGMNVMGYQSKVDQERKRKEVLKKLEEIDAISTVRREWEKKLPDDRYMSIFLNSFDSEEGEEG